MIKKINISRQNVHLFFGILLSVFVLVQSAQVTSIAENSAEQTDQTDQKETEKNADVTVSQTQAIANSPSQINISFDSYLLDVVTFKEEKDEKKSVYQQVVPRVNNAIRVLLNKIISPNAP